MLHREQRRRGNKLSTGGELERTQTIQRTGVSNGREEGHSARGENAATQLKTEEELEKAENVRRVMSYKFKSRH